MTVRDETVTDTHRNELTLRTTADFTRAIRGRGAVFGFPRSVAIINRVEWIVVAVKKIPARDVIHMTVVILVDAIVVLRIENEVLGVDKPVAVAVSNRAKVVDVDDTIAIAILRWGCRGTGRWRFESVDVHLGSEVTHRVRVTPPNTAIQDRDRDLRGTGRHTPREVDGHTHLPALIMGRDDQHRVLVAQRCALVVGTVDLARDHTRRGLVGGAVPPVRAIEPDRPTRDAGRR